MDPIPVLYDDRDDEGRLLAFATPDHPGRVIVSLVGPGGVEFELTAGDARRLMYLLSCASIKAIQLARDVATAEAHYDHA